MVVCIVTKSGHKYAFKNYKGKLYCKKDEESSFMQCKIINTKEISVGTKLDVICLDEADDFVTDDIETIKFELDEFDETIK